MNGKSAPVQYRMSYYPGGLAPAGYAVAMADKSGLYTTSPYATIPPGYPGAQGGIPANMQHYTPMHQQYAMVTQPSPYPSAQHPSAAYLASPSPAGFPPPSAGVPMSSLQAGAVPSTQASHYQYASALGVQRAMLAPSSLAASGYGTGPLYATSSYPGLPTALPGQPSQSPYGGAPPVGYAAATSGLPPSGSSSPFQAPGGGSAYY